MYTTINSQFNLGPASECTRINPVGVTSVDKFTYSGAVASKYEQAVIDTVKFLGFMSLKNGEHSVAGANPAANKRILKEAVETRKAADSLLASGAVVLLGTWSNGIAVGPGAGFARVSHENVTPITAKPAKKSRKPAAVKIDRASTLTADQQRAAYAVEAARNERDAQEGACCAVDFLNPEWSREGAKCSMLQHYGTAYVRRTERELYEEERIAAYEEKITGDYCEWTPGVMHGPAYVAPLTPPPGYMLSSFHATCNNGTLAAEWRCIVKRTARATGEAKRVEALPFNFVLYNDGTVRISSNGAFIAEPREKLLAEARAALGIAQPVADAPTPIYTPAVGESVFIVYRHENGSTTDRVIDVQRVGNGVFRGYDRRYGRTRNFYADHVAVIRRWNGEAIYDHNGNIAVAAA